MSYSSLYGIKKDYTGECIYEYQNSWLFSPVIWDVLPDKYIPEFIQTFYGYKKKIIGMGGQEVWLKTNEKINNCNNTPDRICWELSNQNIFHTKDKQIISDSILKFIEQNNEYNKSEDDGISSLKREHIIERFTEIANDISELDENEYPFFVFKNTSVDDEVERWFGKYDKENDKYISKPLSDNEDKEFYAEFVFIKDDKIEKFVSNQDYDFK